MPFDPNDESMDGYCGASPDAARKVLEKRSILRRRRESVLASEVIQWLQARPGISWNATVTDIEKALDDICGPR